MKYERIIRAMENEICAILPSKLEEIVGVIEARANGITASEETLAQIEAKRRQPRIQWKVAVLPIFGAISHRANSVFSSLGASAEQIGKDFDAAMSSAEVSSVVFDIDSPGGSVSGIQELGEKIRSRRAEKPITAAANAGAFSAAFWIATAADELVVTPSGMVGSVGTVAMHVDQSEFNEKIGLKPTFIHAGKFKTEGNPHEPLGEEAHTEMQRMVDSFNDSFVSALAKNRDITTAKVNADFGQGRVFRAAEAVERGMADRVATFERVLAEASGQV